MTQSILLQIARGNFLYLLFSLLLLLLLTPFFAATVIGTILVDIAFSAIFLSAVYAVSERKRLFTLTVILAVPLIVARWSNHLLQNDAFTLVIKILTLVFLVFTTYLMFAHVLKDEEVTANKICGALSVYLMIGVTWALLFGVIEGIHPQSFAIADVQGASSPENILFTYYSFVTLTTLGYGDITPLTPVARAFTFVEAVCGQIYLAVLIARLVGLHIVHSTEN
jgi:hypothetical protein